MKTHVYRTFWEKKTTFKSGIKNDQSEILRLKKSYKLLSKLLIRHRVADYKVAFAYATSWPEMLIKDQI